MQTQTAGKKWFLYALIIVVTALVWGRTVEYNFVWDDEFFIQDNKSVLSLKNIPSMFFSLQAQAKSADRFKVFRPLRTAQYAVCHALSGGGPTPHPKWFHIANICWHAAAAMLLFSVATLLFTRETNKGTEGGAGWVAFLAAIAFAVHPVTSEVVCWAKSLDDIMAAVFVLAATRMLLLPDYTRRSAALTTLFFGLAVYSKESAAPFALLSIFIFRGWHKMDWKKAVTTAMPFFAVAFVYAVHRHLIIGRTSQTAPISGSYGQTLLDMCPVAIDYLRLLLGIPPFEIDYQWMKGHYAVMSGAVAGGVLVIAALSAFGLWSWRRAQWWVVGFGLLWTGLFLLPVSNLIPMMQYMAERFLYLPLIGWLLMIAGLLLRIRKPQVGLGVLLIAIALWVPTTLARETIWKDEQTLFRRSIAEGDRTQRLEDNAVKAFLRQQEVSEVFTINPETGLITVPGFIPDEKVPAVMNALNEAHRLFPENDNLLTVLGMVDLMTGHNTDAPQHFEAAVKRNPRNPQWWINLAIGYAVNERLDAAREAVGQALKVDPTNRAALTLQAKMSFEAHDYETALRQLRVVQQLDPGNSEIRAMIQQAEAQAQFGSGTSHR